MYFVSRVCGCRKDRSFSGIFTRLNQSYTYKGKAVYPNFLIACEQVVETDHGDGTATQIIQYIILQRGQDYKASISGNRGIGKATVTAVGKGSYAGQRSSAAEMPESMKRFYW